MYMSKDRNGNRCSFLNPCRAAPLTCPRDAELFCPLEIHRRVPLRCPGCKRFTLWHPGEIIARTCCYIKRMRDVLHQWQLQHDARGTPDWFIRHPTILGQGPLGQGQGLSDLTIRVSTRCAGHRVLSLPAWLLGVSLFLGLLHGSGVIGVVQMLEPYNQRFKAILPSFV